MDPQHIGPYELLQQLGSGGMGDVYRARHIYLDKIVALKTMRAGDANDPLELARFKREVRVAAALDHPHLVKTLDGGIANGRFYLAMELVEGENLEELLRREGAFPWVRTVRIAIQLVEAIGYLHAQGVLHRDVKPANILVQGSDQVKLSDFGLARVDNTTQLTQSGCLLGTPLYLPPEALDQEKATAAWDRWGLGCVLYRMSTGAFPVEPVLADVTAFVRALHDGPIRPPDQHNPRIPAKLSALVMRLLDRIPSARPDVLGVVLPALHALRPGGQPTHQAKPRKNALLLWIALVPLLVVAALLTFTRLPHHDRPRARDTAFHRVWMELLRGSVTQAVAGAADRRARGDRTTETRLIEAFGLLHETWRTPEARELFDAVARDDPDPDVRACAKTLALSLAGRSRAAAEAARTGILLDPQAPDAFQLVALPWVGKSGPAVLAGWKRLVSQDPDSPVYHYHYASQLLTAKRTTEARQEWQHCVDRLPSSVLLYAMSAAIYSAQGRTAGTVGAWREALRRDADSVQSRLNLARSLQLAGRREDALNTLAGIPESKASIHSRFVKALIYTDLGRMDSAKREILAAFATAQVREDWIHPWCMGLASQLVGKGIAVDQAKGFWLDNKAHQRVALFLGEHLRALGRQTEAKTLAIELTRMDSPEPRAIRLHAQIAVVEKSYAEALTDFRKLAQLEPENGAIHYEIAQQLQNLNRHEEVDVEYESAGRLAPDNPVIFLRWGQWLKSRGRLGPAVEKLQLGVAKGLKTPVYRAELAFALAAAGDITGAEKEWRHIIQAEPSSVRYWGELLNVLRARKGLQEVEIELRSAIARVPKQPWLHLFLAEILLDRADRAGAAAAVQAAARIAGDAPDLAPTFAATLERAGMLAEAVPYYRATLKTTDRPVEVRRKLRDIMYLLGDLDGACEMQDHLPPIPGWHLAMAEKYAKKSRFPEQIRELLRAGATDRQNLAIPAQITHVLTHMGPGKPELDLLLQVLGQYPTFSGVDALALQTLMTLTRAEDRERLARPLLRTHPGNRHVARMLFNALTEQGRWTEAAQIGHLLDSRPAPTVR